MWHSIRRWAGWAPKLWPFVRCPVRLRAIRYGYDRAGISIEGQPIPWTADGVRVEAELALPPGISLRRDDFSLLLPEQAPVVADLFRRDQGHVVFRLPPPGGTVSATVSYRGWRLGQVVLPFLSREEFLKSIWLQWPTTFLRLGMETVTGTTFVSRQCRGLHESAILCGSYPLVPLLDERLEVEYRCRRTGATVTLPVCLSPGQLSQSKAMVTVAPPRWPRRPGRWEVTWRIGERLLLWHRCLRGISRKAFQRSLRISDSHFVVPDPSGALRRGEQVPLLTPGVRLGPSFLVSSARHGMVGLCRVEVRPLFPRGERGPILLEREVLLAGGPTLVAPGTVDAAELARVVAFEVSVAGHVLGTIPLRPVPAATFTSEGGYKAPEEYPWSAAAEEEMLDRLHRLIAEGSKGPKVG